MSETGAMSWKQKGRYLKEKPIPEEPKKGRNHKDTKKWCKGVKGRQHNYVWVPDLRHVYNGKSDWYKYECTQCNKQADYCFFWNYEQSLGLGRTCKCGFHVKVEHDSE